jgi:predicted transcriptional regulator
MNSQQNSTIKKVQLSGKVPPDLKQKVEIIAKSEDRSVSYILTRLLLTHPEIKSKKSLALQS